MPANYTTAPVNPPTNPVQASEELLACALIGLGPDAAGERASILAHFRQDDILCPVVSAVVAAVRSLDETGERVELGSVMHTLADRGQYANGTAEGLVTHAALIRIFDSRLEAHNALYHARRVADAAYSRRVVRVGERLAAVASESAEPQRIFDLVAELGELTGRRKVDRDWGSVAFADRSRKLGLSTDEELVIAYPNEEPEVIQGVVRRGELALVTGASKVGKSWYALQAAIAVSTGAEFLGRKTTGGRVVFVDLELRPATLAQRIKKIRLHVSGGVTGSDQLMFATFRGKADCWKALCQLLDGLSPADDIALIVVDPVFRLFANVDGADENNNSQVAEFLNRLIVHAERLGAAMMVTAHAGKGATTSEKAAVDMTSGAGSFARVPDTLLCIRHHRVERHMVEQAITRSFASPEDATIRKVIPTGGGVAYEAAPQVAAELLTGKGKQVSLSDWEGSREPDTVSTDVDSWQPVKSAITAERVADLVRTAGILPKKAAIQRIRDELGASLRMAEGTLATAVSQGLLSEWNRGTTKYVGTHPTATMAE